MIYDICIAWNWPYDRDFIGICEEQCARSGLSELMITTDVLSERYEALRSGSISFLSLFDRASDTDKKFILFDQWAVEHQVYRINPRERALRAYNKATMHLELIASGIDTPYSIILPPYEGQPFLPAFDLSPLGNNFFIKPAHGGGGEGVVRNANTMHDVMIARQMHPADHYLLQRQVTSTRIEGRPAWFRVISCGGNIFPNWWNPFTHQYTPVSLDEVYRYDLEALWTITDTVAKVCGLDLFSSEIALTPENKFVVVDYVNDQIDLRLQSAASDGVPDQTIQRIAQILSAMVYHYTRVSASPWPFVCC